MPALKNNHLNRPGGIKKIVENFTLPKPRAERLHLKTKDSSIKKVKAEGIKAYPEMHALSTKSYEHTDTMGKKQPVDGLLNQRNNIPLTSMGDKAYKYPEYSKDFYKEGGLMVGSSNVMTYKTSGIVMDFYSNVQLKDGVPNTAVKWKDKVKKETQDHDQKLVASLYDWYVWHCCGELIFGRERAVLKEADPNFRDPDYSSGDEAPVKEAKPAQPQGKPAARPGRK